ncbi:hypothetical protein L209DRAFT_756039 [Thermothelomyces heterothallicus CBS 203.75]
MYAILLFPAFSLLVPQPSWEGQPLSKLSPVHYCVLMHEYCPMFQVDSFLCPSTPTRVPVIPVPPQVFLGSFR